MKSLKQFFLQNGAALAPALVGCLMVICIHGLGYGHTLSEVVKSLLYVSYLRFGIVGLVNAIYENRDNLNCKEVYCLYSEPQVLLKHLGMTNSWFFSQVLGLIFFTLLFKIIGFFTLKMTLRKDATAKYLNLFKKLVNRTGSKLKSTKR